MPRLTESFEVLMSGEDFARYVQIMGGVEASAAHFNCSPEQIDAHMQEGRIMRGVRTPVLKPKEVQDIMSQIGIESVEEFASFVGLSLEAAKKMTGLEASM
jgi:hypothetical protein